MITGVIPLEAVLLHYRKGLTFGGESSLGSSSVGNHMVLVTPYTPADKRGRTEFPKILKGENELTHKETILNT